MMIEIGTMLCLYFFVSVLGETEMSEENQANQGRVRKDGTPWKERTIVEDTEFFPQYKKAMTSGVKLADFAAKIGQAPATILQRVAKANKILKSSGKNPLKYLSSASGTPGVRGRKSITAEELIKLLGD